ncbi:uncharacterized protein L3040_007819 [Drepanopeziza brunnea f. sp. 'multigermtubi']|uniref:uncharacterized protein n=1 Tax=Drepanopeziza brunnea f. sp. 'multigermtubi' TaxID=698441 RepID=UPI0023898166|nr:hypothetical protein L3040_007819 [Drepanopeziza brunnea f. sp. 'multigermtubi']
MQVAKNTRFASHGRTSHFAYWIAPCRLWVSGRDNEGAVTGQLWGLALPSLELITIAKPSRDGTQFAAKRSLLPKNRSDISSSERGLANTDVQPVSSSTDEVIGNFPATFTTILVLEIKYWECRVEASWIIPEKETRTETKYFCGPPVTVPAGIHVKLYARFGNIQPSSSSPYGLHSRCPARIRLEHPPILITRYQRSLLRLRSQGKRSKRRSLARGHARGHYHSDPLCRNGSVRAIQVHRPAERRAATVSTHLAGPNPADINSGDTFRTPW